MTGVLRAELRERVVAYVEACKRQAGTGRVLAAGMAELGLVAPAENTVLNWTSGRHRPGADLLFGLGLLSGFSLDAASGLLGAPRIVPVAELREAHTVAVLRAVDTKLDRLLGAVEGAM